MCKTLCQQTPWAPSKGSPGSPHQEGSTSLFTKHQQRAFYILSHLIRPTIRHFVGKETPAQRGKATCQGHTASKEQRQGSKPPSLKHGFGFCSPCSEVGGWILQPHPPFQNHLPCKAVLPGQPRALSKHWFCDRLFSRDPSNAMLVTSIQ